MSSNSSLPLMNLGFSDPLRRLHSRPVTTSASIRRHRRRRLLKHHPNTPSAPAIFKLTDNNTLQITLKPPSSIQQLETKLNQFVDYSREALDDLRTVVSVDSDTGGVVISCRRSTIEYLVALIVSSLVVIVAFRGLFFRSLRIGAGEEEVMYRRDRSLGGKLVAVGGKREESWGKTTPLSSGSGDLSYVKYRNRNRNRSRSRETELLPQWWPQVVNSGPVDVENKEEYQRMANLLIRAMMDLKMGGKDISPNDIVQLRYLCKTYGVRALVDTANARNSLYRASVNFILDYFESIPNLSTPLQINGEDAREFIAGLADNIGIESAHAARMVSAAVAARTRSKILQCWALEVQNKHSEALDELSKVCHFHRIFPPEANSPEMEMVARGLEKSLSEEQREYILKLFITVCGKDVDRSVVEALGLIQDNVQLADEVMSSD